jgi:hypothetical protein
MNASELLEELERVWQVFVGDLESLTHASHAPRGRIELTPGTPRPNRKVPE